MFFPHVTFSPANNAFVLGITCLAICCSFAKTSPEFQGYLSKVLRNYTEQACDGEYFSVRCPPHTTISIQSSFYGRKGPSPLHCAPQSEQSGTDTNCYVSTSTQKMLDECQDRRSCHILVNSRLFGPDPCPSNSKYLMVWYKCRPNEHKSKVACEGEHMRLSCKRGALIVIYSATFGRSQLGIPECPPYSRRSPTVDCQSGSTLPLLTTRCQGKRSCSVQASSREFGDPCYVGTRKYLSVIYSCVPRKLLQEANPRQEVYLHPLPHDPNVVGDSAPPDGTLHSTDSQLGKKKRGRNSGVYSVEEKTILFDVDERPHLTLSPKMEAVPVRTEMALISNALAAYMFIAEHPERAALYFMCGVCLGLTLILLALVVRISCHADCRAQVPEKQTHAAHSTSHSSDSESDWDSASDLSARRHRRFERTLNTNVFVSAEELERAQRLEERERIIREIWMNGQPDVPGTRSLNRYY
ncbi:protein eva-1 homolog C-like isoform X1 [Arapaima gigas]